MVAINNNSRLYPDWKWKLWWRKLKYCNNFCLLLVGSIQNLYLEYSGFYKTKYPPVNVLELVEQNFVYHNFKAKRVLRLHSLFKQKEKAVGLEDELREQNTNKSKQNRTPRKVIFVYERLCIVCSSTCPVLLFHNMNENKVEIMYKKKDRRTYNVQYFAFIVHRIDLLLVIWPKISIHAGTAHGCLSWRDFLLDRSDYNGEDIAQIKLEFVGSVAISQVKTIL